MRKWAAVAVVAAIALAGVVLVGIKALNYFDRHRTVDPTTPLADQCDEVPEGAERVTFTGDDGETLGAAVVGPADATVGVVLRQGASQTICEWLPWAADVAAATGDRVLLFDRRGRGSSPADGGNLSAEPGDTLKAVQLLRDQGALDVALVASSMGNSIMFAAVPDVSPPPCAVVSISPVLTSRDSHGLVDGSTLRGLPPSLWVTYETGNGSIVTSAQLIASRADHQDLPAVHELGVDTSDHSRQLILKHPEAAAFVTEAIESCS